MQTNLDEQRSIFLQIAEMLENAILSGAYAEEQRIPSITEISVNYRINPATALKGVNILVDSGLLYKKRGLGMFVSEGARGRIAQRRKESFYQDYVRPLLAEAKKLAVDQEELSKLIERGYLDDDRA
ncbi:MAG: GntR family transcriptional regulator [Bacillota bacterium]|nr:GntR family transcriptional regulator [Bacillota bacterium]